MFTSRNLENFFDSMVFPTVGCYVKETIHGFPVEFQGKNLASANTCEFCLFLIVRITVSSFFVESETNHC